MAEERKEEFLTALTNAKASGTGEVFQFKVGRNLSQMVKDGHYDYDIQGAVAISLILACSAIPDASIMLQDDQPEHLSVETIGEDGSPILKSNPDEVKELNRSNFLRAVLNSQRASLGWLRDLVMCHQVKPLSDRNCTNYFAAMNGTPVNGRDIVDILNVARNLLPRLVDNVDVRGSATDIEFIKYHIAYASTPGLVKRMLTDLSAFLEISDETIDIVDAAIEQFWSREVTNRIPTKVIAMTHAYLRSMGTLPDNWYQGEKAVQIVNVALYAKWRTIFKRWKELSTGVEAIEAAADMRALAAAAGDGVLSV